VRALWLLNFKLLWRGGRLSALCSSSTVLHECTCECVSVVMIRPVRIKVRYHMFKLTCVCGVFCVHLSIMAVVVESLRKRGSIVSCCPSVLSVVAFILDRLKL
jgi:hypothetical protein